LQKKAFVYYDTPPAKWVSKYGSITFNIGAEFPVAGMNEKGLVISLMALHNGGELPEKDERLSIGNTLAWVQYQLDTSATVKDVIETNKTIRCSDCKGIPTSLHYFVSDKNKNAAVIEFLRGEMVVHTGDELPIPLVTNWKYDSDVKKLVDFINFENQDVIEIFGKGSINTDSYTVVDETADPRFIIGTYKIKKYQKHPDKSLINAAFEILESLQFHSKKDDFINNQLTVVFEPINMQISFYTKNNSNIRKLNVKDFDLEKPSIGLMYSMDKDITDPKNDFFPYSNTMNKNQIKKYFIPISEGFGVTEDSLYYKRIQKGLKRMGNYPKTFQYSDNESTN
jgi:penicillin V acylase-like amidase (Ntn superfamily)